MDSMLSLTPASNLFARMLASKMTVKKWPAAILAGTIAPAMFVASASAADLQIAPDQVIDSDAGVAIFNEGLIEGFLNANNDQTTANPNNSTPEFGLRMATTTAFGPDGWANPRTWIYTGQIFTGPNGVISVAANNDDTDWFRINGTVVLNDATWNTPVAGTAAGLTPNTWVDFEYRVSDSGGGGAGPSGQQGGGSGWSGSIGAVISHDDELNSLNAADYTYGLGGVGSYEVANGTPELFRYFVGNGLSDDLLITSSGTLTINGVSAGVNESSLRFENAAPATFTINDGTGSHKTLGVLGLTQWATATSGGAAVTLAGTSDLRPGQMTDNGIAVTVTQSGPGSLILDSTTVNTVTNTTFSAVGGTIVVSGAVNPIAGAILRIDNAAGTLRFGGSGTFNNPVTANAAGALSKIDNSVSIVCGAVALGAAPLNVDVTQGTLRLSGSVTGNGFVKTGGGTFETSLAVNLPSATVNAGTFRTLAGSTFTNASVSGGLFETNGTTTIPTGGSVSITGGEFRSNGALTLSGTASLTQSAGTLTTTGALSISAVGSSFNVSGGTAVISGNGTIIRNANVSGGLVRTEGSTTINTLNLTGGRLQANGALSVSGAPTVSAGATLALRATAGNAINNAVFGTPLSVSGGTIEIVPGALPDVGGFDPKPITLSGGTLALDTQHGLTARIYNTAPTTTGDPAYNPNWGPQELLPGNGDFAAFSALYAGLETGGGARVTSVTTLNGRTQLSFPDTQGAPYGSLGASFTDNIQARLEGQFYAPVAGTYSFGTTSDDGSILFINGVSVVYNNRNQGMTRRTGSITLAAGLHSIEIGHFEGGGGAGLIVDITKPGSANEVLNNADLLLSATVPVFDNIITASAAGGTINVIAPRAIAQSVIVPDASIFGASGNRLTVEALDLTGATNSTFNIANETTVLQVTDGAGVVGLVKSGAGTLVFDTPVNPQFQNAGSSITVNQGAVGLVLGPGNNPTGNASIVFNGGGVVLSSKDGLNKSYPAPDFTNGGVLGARVIGSGLPGTVGTPIVVTMTGNLQVGAGNTLSMSTADFYEMSVGGSASGSGTVAIGTGVINSTSNTALQGLNILMNPLSGGDPAILKLKTNSPTVRTLATTGGGTSQIIVGDGVSPATLSLTGPTSPDVTRFAGAITENGGQQVTLNANGTGTLILGGASTFTGGVSVTTGTLELANNAAAGTGAISLGGGTLQFSNPGLLLKLYDSNPGNSGAYTAGVLNSTLANVLSHFSGLGTPTVTTTTAANGNTAINYPSDANANPPNRDGAPFAVHGFSAIDNMEALFSGKFDAGAGGTFKFSPRSDDGTTIYINGTLLVDNNFPQGVDENTQAPRDGTIVLAPGLHDIVMTFNEGGGGAGMFVDYTPPGGVRQLLLNGNASAPTLFTNEFFNSANPVNVTSSSTLNLRNGTVGLGALTQTAGTTLTATAGQVTFSDAILPTAGAYNIDGAGTVVFNQVTDGGNNVTINRTGGGTLILGLPTIAQLSGASAFNISGGSSLVAVGDTTFNPLGNASVTLSGNSALKLSSALGDVNFSNSILMSGSAAISAGNFGGGAVNGPAITALTSQVFVGGGNTLTVSSSNSYTLGFGDGFGSGGISGAGNVLMTGGNVEANDNINIGGNLTVTGGTFTSKQTTTAAQIDISTGTLAALGNIATTTGTNVGNKGNLQLNGSAITGPVTVNGGRILAATGINDMTPVALSVAATSTTNNANMLRASLYMATGTGVNNDNGVNQNIPALTPDVALDLTLPIDNPQGVNADAIFTGLFGGTLPGAAPFTVVATGFYTANASGTHVFNLTNNDDTAVFWMDLNHNGIFESNGSAGSELLVNLGCCGGNAPNNVSLLGGEKYQVLIAVEDTGGQSGLVARFTQNGGVDSIIEPGAAGQAGVWSYETVSGGGSLEVAALAQMNAGVVTNGRVKVADSGAFAATQLLNNEGIELVGGATPGSESSLTLTAGAATASNATSLTVSGGGGTAGIVSLDANSTLTTTYLALSPGGRLIKDGAGTLTATNQTLGTGSTLEIRGGLVNLRGDTFANNEGANDGDALVDGAASTLNLIRAIAGDITLDNDGTLQAAGSFTYAAVLNVGAGGGVVDTDGFNITATGGVNGAGGELTKIDAGTLALSGVITLDTLTANGGTTSLGSSVTLTALNIGAGATVVLDATPPVPALEAPAFVAAEGAGQSVIPEPGSAALLLTGVLGLLARRRRRE